jgi:NodT family efflux transporter outer membrane factor (OMF) lipoprotein
MKIPSVDTGVPSAFEGDYLSATPAGGIDNWWTLFDDRQLDTLIEQALRAAPDARTALAELNEARALRRQALTAYDPQGSFTASASTTHTHLANVPAVERPYITTTPSDPIVTASLPISWEVDLFGRRVAAKTAAEADLAAAQFDYHATRVALAASVATSLFQARGIAAQLVEAQETSRIADQLASLGQLRAQSGLGSDVDAARLQSDAASRRSDMIALAAQLRVARRTLLVLLGRGAEPTDELTIEPDLPSPPRPPALTPADVMARRPDVLEAEARLRSTIGTLRLDRLDLFPHLALQPGATYTLITGPLGYSSTAWSLAAGLTMPLLDRKRLLAQLDAQSARTEMAAIAYERTVQGAFGESENSLTTLTSDLARLDNLSRAEEEASFAFTAQQKGYRAGILDLDSLLQTERTWREARVALIGLRTTALVDAVTSFKALGGGWSPVASASGVAQ